MNYRETADAQLRFNARQTEWIERTSSLAHVRDYSKGIDPHHEDALDATVYAFGAAAFASNVVGGWSWLSSEGDLGALATLGFGASLVLGTIAVTRYARRKQRNAKRGFEIATLVPKFDRRLHRGADDHETAITYLVVNKQERVWPSRLESQRVSLGQFEQVRLCVVNDGLRTYIEWAYPL